MKTLSHLPLLTLFILLSGCGGDSPTDTDGLTLDDLVGSWIATSDLHTNKANSSETFDVVAEGGEVRITMLPGGNTRTWVELGTFMDEWDSAVTLSGNTLTVDPVEAGRPTRVWETALVSGVLTLTSDDGEFDFTLTGATPVSTTEVLVMVPN
jgi:hypothetical protein